MSLMKSKSAALAGRRDGSARRSALARPRGTNRSGQFSEKREESAVPEQEPSADKRKKAERDARDAKILWYILMALRVVIPAYMLYVVYLYWTTPFSAYLQGPR